MNNFTDYINQLDTVNFDKHLILNINLILLNSTFLIHYLNT